MILQREWLRLKKFGVSISLLALDTRVILPVATASIERVFSAMKVIKNRLRNRIENNWLNTCLITYIDTDVFKKVKNKVIMQRFHSIKPRREQL